MFDINNVNLPKWPALVVIGEKVSEEEAAEILIRTDCFTFSSNDRDFDRQLIEAVGVKYEDKYPYYDWEELCKKREEYKVLKLGYLHNWQIVSSWIGGPHGWCDWHGRIGCSNFNIGKWPGANTVLEEWAIIADAFPFLSLKSQLFSGETCEDGIEPVIQYDVLHGKVYAVEPERQISAINPLSDSHMFARLTSAYGERGCTIEQFKEALEITKRRLKERQEILL